MSWGGVQLRKPCDIAFRIMLTHWRMNPADVVYVGDNANKDFQACRQLGMMSVWFDNSKELNSAGWIIGCKIGKAILSLITTMVVARYLGVYNYGLISYAAGLVTFATPLMRLGIDSILVYEIVNKPNKDGMILGRYCIKCYIFSLCVLGIVSFCLIANGGETETLIVCLCYSLALPFQAVEIGHL